MPPPQINLYLALQCTKTANDLYNLVHPPHFAYVAHYMLWLHYSIAIELDQFGVAVGWLSAVCIYEKRKSPISQPTESIMSTNCDYAQILILCARRYRRSLP